MEIVFIVYFWHRSEFSPRILCYLDGGNLVTIFMLFFYDFIHAHTKNRLL